MYRYVRDIPVSERPRERLALKGAASLSLQELFAIVINQGSKDNSSLDISSAMLRSFGSLQRIASAAPDELQTVSGIGLAKALQIQAAVEIGKRFYAERGADIGTILDTEQAFELASYYLKGKMREHLLLFSLNVRGALIAQPDIVSIGTLDASCVHPREIFGAAIGRNAARVLLAHNHPSGNPDPSDADLAVTSQLCQAGEIMGIAVIDHIIVGDGKHRSLRQSNPELFRQ